MKKILAVVGARPQFIKHAPIELAFKGHFHLVTVHTGQHYDDNMSRIFFDQLGMSRPDYLLQVGSSGHGVQTGRMLAEIEPILEKEKPDAVLVYGDTNSTLAGALAAAKMLIPVIHLEAGLRSYNKTMPEEINRVLTDHISSLLLVPTVQAVENLRKEGVTENVHLTGDVMGDMVRIAEKILKNTEPTGGEYCLATLHRPYNTDEPARLAEVLTALNGISCKVKLALHPRTRHKMQAFGLPEDRFPNIEFLEPVSYFDNIALQKNSLAVITDSGGMQKEAYLLRRPCVTIRTETEWVETLENDWNVLAFNRLNELDALVRRVPGAHHPGVYGDGDAAGEIAGIVESWLL